VALPLLRCPPEPCVRDVAADVPKGQRLEDVLPEAKPVPGIEAKAEESALDVRQSLGINMGKVASRVDDEVSPGHFDLLCASLKSLSVKRKLASKHAVPETGIHAAS